MIRILLIAALAVVAIASPASAQAQPPQASAPAATFDLSIDQPASLADVLDLVRAHDPNFNVVLFDRGVPADTTMVPPLKLKNVTAEQVLYLVADGVAALVDVQRHVGPDGRQIFRVALGRPARNEESLLRVFPVRAVADRLASVEGEPGPERDQKIEEKVTQILSLIELARTINEGDAKRPAPQMHYHPGTGMLIMKGTPEQLWAAEEVVKAFSQSVRTVQGFGFGSGTPTPAPPGGATNKLEGDGEIGGNRSFDPLMGPGGGGSGNRRRAPTTRP